MSLILEALKKSEQQRRLGEAPTLGSPVVATRRRRSLLPLIAVLIVAVAAVGWWLSRPSGTPSAPVAAAPPAGAAGGRPAPAKTAPTPPITTERAHDRAAPATPPAARPAPDKHALATAPNATTPAATPAPAPARLPASAPPAAHDKTAAAPIAAPVKAPPRKGALQMDIPPRDAARDQPAVAATRSSPTATKPAATKPAEPAVPMIWELPYATRKDLPPIELSMHVYSADPKQRFVVLKGERRVEGDDLGDDLVLRAIRQDGIVLEFKGQAFFYPRTGR